METYLTGIFPRSEKLIAATRGLDRRRVSEEEVEQVLRKDVEGVVRLQEEAGVACYSDGLLNWQDIFRPLVEAWEGLSLGGLMRWFDNNTFFRQPIISGDPQPGFIPEKYMKTGLLPDGRAWKAVLPGPYTFADLAEDHHFSRPEELVVALAECLARASEGLRGLGFTHLQFTEPSLVINPPSDGLWQAVSDAYELLRGKGQEISLQLFFGPAASLLPQILDLPVDVIGLDLYEEDLGQLAGLDFDKALACGCVDARNSLLESPDSVVDLAGRVLDTLSPVDLILCPNADLELLPRRVAEEKVRVLGTACSILKEGA